MNTTIKRTLHACIVAFAFGLSAAFTHALPLREFYKLSLNDQGNLYITTANDIRDRLWSEFDAKGNRKPEKVLRAQREYANFIADLIEKKDERGIRVNIMQIHRFVYSEYILNPDGHLETAVLKFTRKALEEKIAADKSRAKATK